MTFTDERLWGYTRVRMNTDEIHIAVVGAGAAGLAAGIFAAETARPHPLRVVLLDGQRNRTGGWRHAGLPWTQG